MHSCHAGARRARPLAYSAEGRKIGVAAVCDVLADEAELLFGDDAIMVWIQLVDKILN